VGSISPRIFHQGFTAMFDLGRLSKSKLRRLELKNKVEVLEMILDLKLRDQPHLIKSAKQKLRADYIKKVT
jgi:hypothetical protein